MEMEANERASEQTLSLAGQEVCVCVRVSAFNMKIESSISSGTVPCLPNFTLAPIWFEKLSEELS